MASHASVIGNASAVKVRDLRSVPDSLHRAGLSMRPVLTSSTYVCVAGVISGKIAKEVLPQLLEGAGNEKGIKVRTTPYTTNCGEGRTSGQTLLPTGDEVMPTPVPGLHREQGHAHDQ